MWELYRTYPWVVTVLLLLVLDHRWMAEQMVLLHLVEMLPLCVILLGWPREDPSVRWTFLVGYFLVVMVGLSWCVIEEVQTSRDCSIRMEPTWK